MDAAPDVEAEVVAEPEPEGPAGHGTIRLRTAASPAAVEAALDAAPGVEAEVVGEPEPAAAPSSAGSSEVQRLEAEAKAAAQAAYEAYNPGHGKQPAGNAGELLAKAAQAAQALAAAKGA